MAERDIGVPGAMARALGLLRERIPAERLDRVWVFPPLADGRSESGLVAAGCFGEGSRRLLVTVAYRAEETGRGIDFTPSFEEQGTAPRESLPRVIEGVVRRSDGHFGVPRCTYVEGDPEALERLIGEWTPAEPPHRMAPPFPGAPGRTAPEETRS